MSHLGQERKHVQGCKSASLGGLGAPAESLGWGSRAMLGVAL